LKLKVSRFHLHNLDEANQEVGDVTIAVATAADCIGHTFQGHLADPGSRSPGQLEQCGEIQL
jgi:hypothetical protein